MKSLYIAVDFDGTCVTHEFPEIGKDIGAQKVLKRLVTSGHKLILNTMRGNLVSRLNPTGRNHIAEAIQWFKDNNIPIVAVYKHPTQTHWTNSYKCHADLYIDDRNVCMPKIHDITICETPFVDWPTLEQWLVANYIIQD